MKKLPLQICLAFLLLALMPHNAYSQRRGGGGGNGGGRNQTGRRATPTPTPAPTPDPTPAPTEAVQSTILSMATGLVTISKGNPPMPATYKVTTYTVITLNGQTTSFAYLKPGMQVSLTPTVDQMYAQSIAATAAPPTPPPVAPVAAVSVPQAPPGMVTGGAPAGSAGASTVYGTASGHDTPATTPLPPAGTDAAPMDK